MRAYPILVDRHVDAVNNSAVMSATLREHLANLGPKREPSLRVQELQNSLDEFGYVRIRVMSRQEALDLADELIAILPEQITPNQCESHWYHGMLDPDRSMTVATARLVWHGFMKRVMEDMLHNARCQWASVAVKPAGAAPTPIHHHWPSTLDPFARRLVCWTVLTDSPEQARTFQVVPRSHQILPHIRTSDTRDYFEEFSGVLMERYVEDLVIEPGEAVIFEDTLLHAVGPNPGELHRICGIATFAGSDMPSAKFERLSDGIFGVFCPAERADFEEFLKSATWPKSFKKIAILPDRNRLISIKEFDLVLANGPKAGISDVALDEIEICGDYGSKS